MPLNSDNKNTPNLGGEDYIFLGILTVLGLLCICIIALLYAEIISNRCDFTITYNTLNKETLSYVGNS